MCGILSEGRGCLGVADGVRLFDGGHPRVSFEVAGYGESGEVPLEVILMSARLALGTIYK